MISWYVMQSKPQKERFLNSQLSINLIETFLPLIRTTNRNGKPMTRSFFPGYMFVHVDLANQGISDLNWIPGARGLVCFGDQPASVPDQFITQLRKKLEVVNTKPGSNYNKHQPGDLVTIVSGPLKGYQAIFNHYLPEKDRVRLFLKLLSENTISLEVPATHIS